MTKCVKIDRCLDCNKFVGSDGYYYNSFCKITKNTGDMWGKPIYNANFIPSWCPLEDA